MRRKKIYFDDVVEYVYEELSDELCEKMDVEEVKIFFELQLEFMQSKKLLIEGVVISCEDESDGLLYYLQHNLVQYDLFLSEEEIDELLDLEKSFYELHVWRENLVSFPLDKGNW